MDDSLGDRMKLLEGREAARQTLPLLPVCVRLDGKGFSKYTKDFKRPYDQRLSDLMVDTTKFLVEASNACVGYTQSDEISLILYSSNSYDSQIFFDGKIQKLTSVLASMCTAFFNSQTCKLQSSSQRLPLAFFDCRVWDVPTKQEAVNTVLWRELDATKNAVSMAARHYYSHNELMNKHGGEMQEMLFQKGVNFNDYPAFFKRGTFLQRRSVLRKFTADEIAVLPEKHEARFNPNLEIERHEVRVLEMPPFMKVLNRVEVIFDGADPKTA